MKIQEGLDILVSYQDYISALAAVSAVLPSFKAFYFAKTIGPVSAVSGLYKNTCAVYEHLNYVNLAVSEFNGSVLEGKQGAILAHADS